ncbi:hypothetical protein BH23CYA1_BH23CYA1_14070 [soil metagenome]
MFFRKLYPESCGYFSYFIDSKETGKALILNVRQDSCLQKIFSVPGRMSAWNQASFETVNPSS